jgi:hypothetical protein
MQLGQAVVEGVIGGAVVLGGVLFAEALARSRDRRELIIARIQELSIIMPRYLSHLTGRSDFPEPSGEAFQHLYERVLACLTDIRFAARRPLKGHRRLRREAEDLTARFVGATIRSQRGGTLRLEELVNIGVGQLRAVLVGNEYLPLDALIDKYRLDIPPYPEDDQ